MTTIQITCTIIVVIATIINLFFAYRNFIEKTAVVEIKVENLPPYTNPEDRTTVLLKNVGTTKTSTNLETLITCSWMSNISYKLNLPNPAFFLAPN
jgi:ribosomal protein S8E